MGGLFVTFCNMCRPVLLYMQMMCAVGVKLRREKRLRRSLVTGTRDAPTP